VRAKSVVQKLHTALCGHLYDGCSVDRVRVSGSRGRSTSLMDSDLDLVLFLNNALPPWEPALEGILRRLQSSFNVDVTATRCVPAPAPACAFLLAVFTYAFVQRTLQPVRSAHRAARRAAG
jgi:hypothetical protein